MYYLKKYGLIPSDIAVGGEGVINVCGFSLN